MVYHYIAQFKPTQIIQEFYNIFYLNHKKKKTAEDKKSLISVKKFMKFLVCSC